MFPMSLFLMKHGVTKFSFSKSNQAEKKLLGQLTRAPYLHRDILFGEKEGSLFREGI